MRPLTLKSLGLPGTALALALAAPAVAPAGPAAEIVARQTSAARPAAPSAAAAAAAATTIASNATVCPGCLQKASESNGLIPMPPANARLGPVCEACQVEAQIAEENAAEKGGPVPARVARATAMLRRSSASAPSPAPSMVMTEGPAAGYAVVGGSPEMASMPAGHAVAGSRGEAAGPVGEPMPIGVVRAGYRSNPAGPDPAQMGMGMPAGGRPMAPGAAAGPGQPPRGSSPLNPMNGPPRRGPHFLSHLFYNYTTTGRHAQQENERRTREAHAMISYDSNGQAPSSLPMSAVYGR